MGFAQLDDKTSKIDAKIRQGRICPKPIEMTTKIQKRESRTGAKRLEGVKINGLKSVNFDLFAYCMSRLAEGPSKGYG